MIIGFLTSAPRTLATLARDNGTLSALALVLGVVGGCMLSAYREQMKERRAIGLRRPERRG
jgi:hypothetical protein